VDFFNVLVGGDWDTCSDLAYEWDIASLLWLLSWFVSWE